MLQKHSLRHRVAFYYALFGAGLSIMLSSGVYWTVQKIGTHLIDETLQVEMDEHAGYLAFVSPNTKSIIGYAHYRDEPEDLIPEELRALKPGHYDVRVKNNDYRVLVEDKNDARFYMLFDTESLHDREDTFFQYMIYFAIFMIVSSSIGGVLLASRVTASVTRLANQVVQADPGDADLALVELDSNDEVGELARAFDRYLKRLREFIEREKYFTADVSHELRTPLAIMLGTVEVMEQDESLTQKQRSKIARIRRAVQDMIDLTSALLLMAREHQHFADETLCHVGEVMRTCVEKHMPLTAGRPIRLEVELAGEPELIVEQPLLEVVIGNLIRNALFNTKAGSVVVRLEKDRLSVRDTGIGMRPEDLARATDRYYKGPSSTGSGVGLSLVKRICQRYGWHILLQSEEGRGTTATIEFSPAPESTRP